jgi:hypothetical protein
MSAKTFLLATAAITAGIGLVLLVFPSFIANFFLAKPGHGEDIFIRFLGSSLIGYTYLNWFTTTDGQRSLRATLIGNFSTLCIALIISVAGVINHTLKATGLFIVLLHVTFVSGFGWFLYRSYTRK